MRDGSLRYHPTAEQRCLIGEFERPLVALMPIARLHDAPAGEAASCWSTMAEMGLFSLGLPEEVGGTGLGASEEALLAERLGRQLASPSILATMMAVHAEDGGIAQQAASACLRVAAGWRRADRLSILDGDGCTLALAFDGDGALLLPIGETQARDGRLWAAELGESAWPSPLTILSGTRLLRARLIVAAALCGIAAAATEMAVAYAGIREQFGHPIGAFQAVKHHCTNMALAARSAFDLATFAAVALDCERPDAALQVEAATLLAIKAATGNARLNIQVHGGMGFSDEADPHLLLKRAHGLTTWAGGEYAAAERLAALPSAW